MLLCTANAAKGEDYSRSKEHAFRSRGEVNIDPSRPAAAEGDRALRVRSHVQRVPLGTVAIGAGGKDILGELGYSQKCVALLFAFDPAVVPDWSSILPNGGSRAGPEAARCLIIQGREQLFGFEELGDVPADVEKGGAALLALSLW